MNSTFYAPLSNQLSAHNLNAIRLHSRGVKHYFWHKSSVVEEHARVSYLSTRLSCLLGHPSRHWAGESHVWLKSDLLQFDVVIPRVQAALSEQCMIMAGCHMGSIKTALSGWTSHHQVCCYWAMLAPVVNQSPVNRCPCQDAIANAESGTLCWQYWTSLSSPIRLEFPSIAVCAGSVSGKSNAPSAQGSGPALLEKKHNRLQFCSFHTFRAWHEGGIVC